MRATLDPGVMTVVDEGRHVAGPPLSPLDRGFLLGDGCFETWRLDEGRHLLFEAHLTRLGRGCELLGLLSSGEEAGAALGRHIHQTCTDLEVRNAVLRLTVTGGRSRKRGIDPANRRPPLTLLLSIDRAAHRDVTTPPRPLRVALSQRRRIPPSCLPATVKHLCYLPAVLAVGEARRAGFDDALMPNEGGELCSGTTANLFGVAGTRLLAPGPAASALAGTTRALIVDIAPGLGFEVVEEALGPPALLKEMDELFFARSTSMITPIVEVEGRPVGSGRPGEATAALAKALHEALSIPYPGFGDLER